MSKWPMRGHFRYLRFKTFPMTPKTPQCEVFCPFLSSSEHSGVPEDSKSPLFQVLGFTPTLDQVRVATHTFLYVFGHCVENICWVWCWYWYQNLGGAPSGPGMPFLDSDTCAEGGVIYFYQGFLPCMMPSMDGWWDGWMDWWMEKASRKTTTMSFTICNVSEQSHLCRRKRVAADKNGH